MLAAASGSALWRNSWDSGGCIHPNVGLLTGALRIAHPVRTAKRSVKHAVIPRSVRRASRAAHTVANPLGAVEGAVKYAAIGAADKAITPRRHRRSRHAAVKQQRRAVRRGQKTARDRALKRNPWTWVFVAWFTAFFSTLLVGMWWLFIVAILFTAGVVLYKFGDRIPRQRSKSARAAAAQDEGPAGPVYVPQNVVRPPSDD